MGWGLRLDARTVGIAVIALAAIVSAFLFPPQLAAAAWWLVLALRSAALFPVPLIAVAVMLWAAWRFGPLFRQELVIPAEGARIPIRKVVVDKDFVYFKPWRGRPFAALLGTVERIGRMWVPRVYVVPVWNRDLGAWVLQTRDESVPEAVQTLRELDYALRENANLKKALMFWSRYGRPPEPPREGGAA